MAKRKLSGKPPQAQHGKKSKSSQHDKRERLATPNPKRKSTTAASVPLIGGVATLCTAMGGLLDKRIGFRLPIVVAGAMLAGGRPTAASWFRCAGVNDDWDRFYDWKFRTKHDLALELCRQVMRSLRTIGSRAGPSHSVDWAGQTNGDKRNVLL